MREFGLAGFAAIAIHFVLVAATAVLNPRPVRAGI
jgi:hypothetical protein